jgi:hypothetical protein
MNSIYKNMRQKTRRWLEWSNLGFRLSIRFRLRASGPHGYPDAPWHTAVLLKQEESNCAVKQVRQLGLPPMQEFSKNWDSLAALDLILKSTTKDAFIFDAGGELYSMILPWLFLYGYKNLIAGNLVFQDPIRRGHIIYQHSDITSTGFRAASYDAITCLSVIEHGVDLRHYFCEMSRILKPGGILITSTDYFETPVDTKGQMAYGAPIHIFTRGEIEHALTIANEYGLTLIAPLDLSANEKLVTWKQHNLSYTFVIFALRKTLIT